MMDVKDQWFQHKRERQREDRMREREREMLG